MSNLETHAERELRRAGLFDEDSDYGGMLGSAVMRLVKQHAAEGHSGMSAEMVMEIFGIVGRFKTLTKLTSDPEEWMEVGDQDGKTLFQSRRQASCFSVDGGKTYYDIDELAPNTERVMHTSEEPRP